MNLSLQIEKINFDISNLLSSLDLTNSKLQSFNQPTHYAFVVFC